MNLFDEIRRVEVDLISRYLPPTGRVLELGGGSGYQARLLAERGYEVVSLDIPSRPPVEHQHHPIITFDGQRIPYPDNHFDALFSSNVLEHVAALAPLLAESRRVLRQGGVAVHTMPTPAWRFWTSITFVLAFPRRLVASYRHHRHSIGRADVSAGVSPRQPGRSIGAASKHASQLRGLFARRNVIPGPHGLPEHGAFHELLVFRRRSWGSVLRRNGFLVTESVEGGLFYTGDLLLPRLSIRRRMQLARWLGSGCRLYFARMI